ncbi:hypothetical protein SCLCIDRAFT_976387 [Scleroderma citrinum Foug A]|uniref:Uncharacterized protein n=1 Tax=Scleroderma citrinum Foug A TaxID=1036808 RepID=A0A0C2ZE39_9AGAM|nr:hypothetical protein SCLCIDRAFT_976387 [Scleroderma citrinum Foug A]
MYGHMTARSNLKRVILCSDESFTSSYGVGKRIHKKRCARKGSRANICIIRGERINETARLNRRKDAEGRTCTINSPSIVPLSRYLSFEHCFENTNMKKRSCKIPRNEKTKKRRKRPRRPEVVAPCSGHAYERNRKRQRMDRNGRVDVGS